MTPQQAAVRLAQTVSIAGDTNGAYLKVALWLLGIFSLTKRDALELTTRCIQRGVMVTPAFDSPLPTATQFPGSGSRPETIRAALKWLEYEGFITITPGKALGGGHVSQVITLKD